MVKAHKFSFELLDQSGSARAVYSSDGIESEFILTNVCNPLGDMLSALVSMLLNPVHLWDETNTAAFVWYCEDESYNWTLTLQKEDILNIRITQSCIFFGDDEVEILNDKCAFFDFVGAIIVELDRFVKQVGLFNYLQIWKNNEFPLTYFLVLKRYLIDSGRWQRLSEAVDGTPILNEINIITR